MATLYPTNQIQALKGRRIFFDTNVLIYLFWSTGGGSAHWERSYSSIYRNLLRQNNELAVDFIVISEFINRAMRMELDKISRGANYKTFRDSADGQTALTDIYVILQDNILDKFTVIGKEFSKADIQSLLTLDTLDFSDKAIVNTCIQNNCVLLTNDADYKIGFFGKSSGNRFCLSL
jgi:predicted nucleic acid-binding protein